MHEFPMCSCQYECMPYHVNRNVSPCSQFVRDVVRCGQGPVHSDWPLFIRSHLVHQQTKLPWITLLGASYSDCIQPCLKCRSLLGVFSITVNNLFQAYCILTSFELCNRAGVQEQYVDFRDCGQFQLTLRFLKFSVFSIVLLAFNYNSLKNATCVSFVCSSTFQHTYENKLIKPRSWHIYSPSRAPLSQILTLSLRREENQ